MGIWLPVLRRKRVSRKPRCLSSLKPSSTLNLELTWENTIPPFGYHSPPLILLQLGLKFPVMINNVTLYNDFNVRIVKELTTNEKTGKLASSVSASKQGLGKARVTLMVWLNQGHPWGQPLCCVWSHCTRWTCFQMARIWTADIGSSFAHDCHVSFTFNYLSYWCLI